MKFKVIWNLADVSLVMDSSVVFICPCVSTDKLSGKLKMLVQAGIYVQTDYHILSFPYSGGIQI